MEKRCYKVKELQEILGLSRASIYELLKRKEFKWVVVGGKYIISKPSFAEWFDGSVHNSYCVDKCQFQSL